MINKTAVCSTKLWLLACVLGLVMAVPAAYAQQGPEATNVAVLNLEGDGVDAKLLDTLTSVLRNEAQQDTSFAIVNQSPVNLSEIVVVLGCDTDNPSCLKQAAEQLEARVLIFGDVEKVERAHKITIEVFDASSGKIEQRLVRTLADEKDPVVVFRRQIQALFTNEVAAEATRLRIGSSVEGAKIKINDTMIGTAPLERKGLPAGRYEVEVYHDGYKTWTSTVELSEGADIRLWAPLSKQKASSDDEVVAQKDTGGDPAATDNQPAPVSDQPEVVSERPPASSTKSTNLGAWSAIGVGGVALAGSAVMALLMNGVEDDLIDHDANRHEMTRDTYIAEREDIIAKGESYELSHRILLGVGAVSVTAGTVWLLLDNSASEDPLFGRTLDVRLSPRGVSALFHW